MRVFLGTLARTSKRVLALKQRTAGAPRGLSMDYGGEHGAEAAAGGPRHPTHSPGRRRECATLPEDKFGANGTGGGERR